MGTWGVGPFENDAAVDWLAGFSESGLSLRQFVRQTLAVVAESTDYLEVDEGQEALAAAAVVIRQSPNQYSSLSFMLPNDIQDTPLHVDDALRELALQAIDHVYQTDTSELTQLLSNDPDFAQLITELRTSLAT